MVYKSMCVMCKRLCVHGVQECVWCARVCVCARVRVQVCVCEGVRVPEHVIMSERVCKCVQYGNIIVAAMAVIKNVCEIEIGWIIKCTVE